MPLSKSDISQLRKLDILKSRRALEDKITFPYETIIFPSKREEIIRKISKKASFDLKTYEETINMPTKPPINWGWMIEEDRMLNFSLHSWENLDAVLASYDKHKDPKMLKYAWNFALDWLNAKENRVDSSSDNFAWYDMAVGLRIYKLAYVFDSLSALDKVEDADIKNAWSSIVDHVEYLNNDENIVFHNNHGLYQAAGQKSSAKRLLPHSKLFEKAIKQSDSRMRKIIKRQFNDEGVHLEHSPDYHRAIYNTLVSLEDSKILNSQLIGGNLLSRAGDALESMIKPSGILLNFGDTDEKLIEKNREEYINSPSDALSGYANSVASKPDKDQAMRVYPKSGLFVVKTGQTIKDSYFALQGAFHSRTHKHADDQSVIWAEGEEDILIDAGKYGYFGKTEFGSDIWKEGFWYSDPKRIFVEKTRAHNTVEIDDKDYTRKNVKLYGTAIKDWTRHRGVYCVKSEVKHFKSIVHSRYSIFKPKKWLIIVDELNDKNKKKHNYKQWFHFSDNFSVENKSDSFYATNTVAKSTVEVLDLTSANRPLGPVLGQDDPELQGWHSKKKAHFEPAPTIAYEADETISAEFATLMSYNSKRRVRVVKKMYRDKSGAINLAWRSGLELNYLRISSDSEGKMKLRLRKLPKLL